MRVFCVCMVTDVTMRGRIVPLTAVRVVLRLLIDLIRRVHSEMGKDIAGARL